MQINLKLGVIQDELNAPKSLKNNFGNYYYRSAETILIALKPLLKKANCVLTLSDELVMVNDRNYVKATAKLMSMEDDESVEVTAYAREEKEKKGMDGSQITGASSSYARKYALNGMFLIDDNQDSDSTNTHGKELSSSDISIFFLKIVPSLHALITSGGKFQHEHLTNVVRKFVSGEMSLEEIKQTYGV